MSRINCGYYSNKKCPLFNNSKYYPLQNKCPKDERKCDLADDLKVTYNTRNLTERLK